jgi:hypothetical protein
VGLVQDQGVVAAELRVGLGFRQQDAVGHDLDAGLRADVVGEAHLPAHQAAQAGFRFLGDARRHALGGDAARLGHAHTAPALLAQAAPAGGQGDLGQLGGLAGTGLAADDDHLVPVQGGGDVFPARRHRQVLGEGQVGYRGGGFGHGAAF